ncbi:MAG: hypothetical protein GF411_19440 [Candidatus Lokiarchaeota archaeon]|nr:hypothetical protein [Candidatus Lokiarchaeota archaeon]
MQILHSAINMVSSPFRVCIVYMSTNGSTRALAKMIAASFPENWDTVLFDLAKVELNNEVFRNSIEEATILGVGSPVFHLDILPPVQKFLDSLSMINGERYAFSFVTYGHVSTGKSVWELSKSLHKKGYIFLSAFKTTAPYFYQDLDFPQTSLDEYVNEFSETIQNRLHDPIPWTNLSEDLKFYSTRVKILYYISRLTRRFRIPDIDFDKTLCRECGRCESICPVQAIDITTLPDRDDSCIHCFACAKSCPTGAISYDKKRWQEVSAFNKSRLTESPEIAVI